MKIKRQHIINSIIILGLLVLRVFIGIQINFAHEDYNQIYLMGLEDAFSGHWSYWGPDVVWSETRLPGALQGLLAGVPFLIYKHAYSPIILSNIISVIGLVLFATYAHKRFPKLPLPYLLTLFLLLPFTFQNGVVLLNTAYLIFSSSILFISIFELFLYRDETMLNKASLYFLLIGFSMMFTYQLHLTWVMILPYLFVLLFMEWKRKEYKWQPILYFIVGVIIGSITLLPTLIKYPEVIFFGMGGNLNFRPDQLAKTFSLYYRFISFATFDISPNFIYFKVTRQTGFIQSVLIYLIKAIGVIQMLLITVTSIYLSKKKRFNQTLILFGLTFLMALILSMMSNKHLSSRTYILLYPIPIWISLYIYDFLKTKFRYTQPILISILPIICMMWIFLGFSNLNGKYSFHSKKEKIQHALQEENPYNFGSRRRTKMDKYNGQ